MSPAKLKTVGSRKKARLHKGALSQVGKASPSLLTKQVKAGNITVADCVNPRKNAQEAPSVVMKVEVKNIGSAAPEYVRVVDMCVPETSFLGGG